MRINFDLKRKLTRNSPRKRRSSKLKLLTKHSIIANNKVRIRAVITVVSYLKVT